MHELALCDALLKKIDDITEGSGLEGINSVTLEIGSLSGVVAEYMLDSWKTVVEDTRYADTELIVKVADGEARCLDCDHLFTADLGKLVCPKCGSSRLMPVSGRDMTILEIEGY